MAWDREKEKKAGKAMTLAGSIFALVFAVFWCLMAWLMGARFMLIFGIPFVGMMGYRLYIMLKLSKEEPKQSPRQEDDPWNRPAPGQHSGVSGYCPYCGGDVRENFTYCPRCGRKL